MARTLVGLDIGSTGVRAAEFVPGRRRAYAAPVRRRCRSPPAWSAPAPSSTARR